MTISILLQAVTPISGATPAVEQTWELIKTLAEPVKAWAEAFALTSAGAFFLYKSFSGYLIANLNLSLTCERKKSKDKNVDYLGVTASLKKGDRGAITLHDAIAKISGPASVLSENPRRLSGTNRLSSKKSTHSIVIVEEPSQTSPQLNLPPGEETMFSTYFEVRADQPCVVEVTILASWRWAAGTRYQWRASQVSLPVSDDNVPKSGKSVSHSL